MIDCLKCPAEDECTVEKNTYLVAKDGDITYQPPRLRKTPLTQCPLANLVVERLKEGQ